MIQGVDGVIQGVDEGIQGVDEGIQGVYDEGNMRLTFDLSSWGW